MIFYFNGNGDLLKSSPENVYQGSNKANTIYVVAPFLPSAQLSVRFTLPNGEHYPETNAVYLTPNGKIDTNKDFSMWTTSITNNVTAYSGTVTAQFFVNTGNETVALQAVSIPISQGVVPNLPAVPETDIYDEILAALAVIETRLPARFIVNVTYDEDSGELTLYYNNNDTITLNFQSTSSTAVVADWLRVVTFTENSWVEVDGTYILALTPENTSFNDNQFIVQLEQTATEIIDNVETIGKSVLADNVFKGTDGTILITSNSKYAGRILLFGGKISFGKVVTEITYDTEKHILTYIYADKEKNTVQLSTKLSEFENDQDFITSTVNNLQNYYLKSEVNALISNISVVRFEVVENLPNIGESNVIYLVPNNGNVPDVYDEYIWVGSAWEKIGSTDVDLSGYSKKFDEIKFSYENAVITYSEQNGITINSTSQKINTDGTTDTFNSSINIPIKAGSGLKLEKATDGEYLILSANVTTADLNKKLDKKTANDNIYTRAYCFNQNEQTERFICTGEESGGIFVGALAAYDSNACLRQNTTPTLNNQVANKSYVDSAINTAVKSTIDTDLTSTTANLVLLKNTRYVRGTLTELTLNFSTEGTFTDGDQIVIEFISGSNATTVTRDTTNAIYNFSTVGANKFVELNAEYKASIGKWVVLSAETPYTAS